MLTGINHLTLSVANLERSFVFYRDALNLKPLCRWQNGAYFLACDDWICLSLKPEYQANPNPDYTHYAFSVQKEDFTKICELIIASGVEQFQENSSEGDSLYFCDPDGHRLEIHVGNWQTRIAAKKANLGSWQDVEFFV